MTEWLKKQWGKLAAGVGLLLAAALLYFAGRWRKNGELNFAAAKRELEINNARGASLEAQLKEVRGKQAEVVADILSEEIALSQKQKANHELSPEDVVARLREHGLIKPKP